MAKFPALPRATGLALSKELLKKKFNYFAESPPGRSRQRALDALGKELFKKN